MGQHVFLHDVHMGETSIANAAEESVLMGFQMIVQRILIAVAFVAMRALVRPDSVVVVHVAGQIFANLESLSANPANMLRSFRVHIIDMTLQADHEQTTVWTLLFSIVHAFQVGFDLNL